MTPHTILVVEDNPATRRMVCFELDKRGHRVLEAPDGKTALELMEREQPALVLQDVILPDVDGFQLVAELRRRARGQVAILAFSGFTSRNDEARISAVGFDDMIIKPIEPARLIAMVEAHVPTSPVIDHFGASRRVLVVDDDALQLKLTRIRLESLGFVVETATDGKVALDVLDRTLPDAVISDVLMPNLDGFGLALAVRRIPTLSQLPVLLVTSSYVDETDRDLARRAGANDLILRTPGQKEMLQTLRALLAAPLPPVVVGTPTLPAIEEERTRRVVQQLERQVLMNAGLAQRCAALAAELTVLTSISDAVLKQGNVEAALEEALASCFDSGGISVGALYLLQADGSFRVRSFGSKITWLASEIQSFFGNELLLRRIIKDGGMVLLPSSELAEAASKDVLDRCDARNAIVVPLVHGDQRIGAMFMVQAQTNAQELAQEDWRIFVQGVGNQIAHALALAGSFAQLEVAERQALESRAEWRALAEHAPDTIARLDRAGVVQFINRVAPPTVPSDIVGKSWLELVPAEYHQQLVGAFETVMTTGQPSDHELMVPGSAGRTDWYSSRIGPILTDGKITGAIVIGRNVTERKQQEAQLIVSDRMVSVGTLAAGVAHEINNPLAAVVANLDLAYREALGIAERSGNRDLPEYLLDAQKAAERVRLIVRDLKVFSRAEEDRLGATDVRTVLESTLRMAWNEIRHRARLVKDFGSVPPVEANESRLSQVFLNLIINATQAMPDGQVNRNEIRITTRLDISGMVAIDVTDTGSGMSEDVRRRLFTPFFTTKPIGVGTGLGLSICQRIVASMDGQIHVRSEVGQGSTFTVLLPTATMGGVVKPVVDPPSGAQRAPRRGRLLVIDDETVIAMAIQRSLSREHDVVYTGTAQEALKRLQAGERFDVILCDLMMPEMTGMDLYYALARSHPEQAERMIFVTGGAFTVKAHEFLQAVPNLRIEKPFNVQQLRTLVNDRVR